MSRFKELSIAKWHCRYHLDWTKLRIVSMYNTKEQKSVKLRLGYNDWPEFQITKPETTLCPRRGHKVFLSPPRGKLNTTSSGGGYLFGLFRLAQQTLR